MRKRAQRALWLSVLLVTTLAVAGWLAVPDRPEGLRSTIAREFPNVRWVDVPTLARWLTSDSPPALLDARAPAEFAVSHLRGAIWVDPDQPDLAALARLRPRRVVVYCSVGYRSAKVAQQLTHAGFEQVWNLEGGIFAWANSGKSVFAGGHAVRRVHPYDRVWGRYLEPELRHSGD
ncbi:MAG: rhodanese-like domain-containing protein [Deltaproteobacteria bacterium]|nr:rhodanese-like domain-containing protein [Deltaproteobacteria bacterium]